LINYITIRITQTNDIHDSGYSLTSTYIGSNHQSFQFYPLHTP